MSLYRILLQMPLQTPFIIESNRKQLIRSVSLRFGRYAIESQYHFPSKIGVYNSSGYYTVYFNDTFFTKTDSPINAIETIIFSNVEYDDSVIVFHGSAVEVNGKANLFLGATGSGKTTLASYLACNGFGVITDDCILIDKNTIMVHPHNTPLRLRKAGYQLLNGMENLNNHIHNIVDGEYDRFIFYPEKMVSDCVPINAIYYISRSDFNDIKRFDKIESLGKLIKSTMKGYQLNVNYFKFLSVLAEIPSYLLCYHEMAYVKKMILDLSTTSHSEVVSF